MEWKKLDFFAPIECSSILLELQLLASRWVGTLPLDLRTRRKSRNKISNTKDRAADRLRASSLTAWSAHARRRRGGAEEGPKAPSSTLNTTSNTLERLQQLVNFKNSLKHPISKHLETLQTPRSGRVLAPAESLHPFRNRFSHNGTQTCVKELLSPCRLHVSHREIG